jgi:hypothetical protein
MEARSDLAKPRSDRQNHLPIIRRSTPIVRFLGCRSPSLAQPQAARMTLVASKTLILNNCINNKSDAHPRWDWQSWVGGGE